MNRREFARVSALSLAATQFSSAADAQPQRKIGYAAVGLGQISSIFMRAVANSSTTKITGLVSGHPEKAARFADMYAVPRSSIYSYEDFDRIRENKDIDATYIGLPNSMHKELHDPFCSGGKACAVREADGDLFGGVPRDDRRVPQGECETDDRLPHSL